MLSLSSFRNKLSGFPSLINYAALIDEGIILGKDGSLLAGFFYKGDDATSSTLTEKNYLSNLINKYLLRFNSGWVIWVNAVRIPSPEYPSTDQFSFPDIITEMIDAERRNMFCQKEAYFETEYSIILQFMPPLQNNQKLNTLLYGEDETSTSDGILSIFKKHLQDFEKGLGDILHLNRMKTITAGEAENTYQSDELVNYLHFIMNGTKLFLRIPDCPMYLDSWFGYKALDATHNLKLDDEHITCIAVNGFPNASCPGILDILDNLPLPYRWSSRFIVLDPQEAIYELKKYRRKWAQKVRSFWSQIFKTQKGIINTDAIAMMHQTEDAINDINSGMIAFGYYTLVIVMTHKNWNFLQERAHYVKREIERRGFYAHIETINSLESWLGSLPGNTYSDVTRPLIHTVNLSHLLPLFSIWPGLAKNSCNLYPKSSPPLMHTITTGATPFRLNLHIDDVGHTLIFGPTGTGKSTLLATILAQFRRYRGNPLQDKTYLPANIVAFDKGYSLYTLCMAVNGVHYDIGSETETPVLMPLANIDTESEALWAEEWITILLQLQTNKPITPDQKSEIHEVITLFRYYVPKENRSLTDFVKLIQSSLIRQALNHYTLEGQMGHILDGNNAHLHMNTFTVFEIDELMSLGEKNAIPVLLYLFKIFERSLKGQPSLLSIDEAWVALGHSVFRDKLRQWLKELRKKNCAVLIATQSLSDAVNSGLLDVLLEQCPTKILLPNHEANQHGTRETLGPADFYTLFGLNNREIEILRQGQYKKHYYYKSPLGRRVFELGLGEIALSFLAISGKEDIEKVKNYVKKFKKEWPLMWLKSKGIDYECYLNF